MKMVKDKLFELGNYQERNNVLAVHDENINVKSSVTLSKLKDRFAKTVIGPIVTSSCETWALEREESIKSFNSCMKNQN